MNTTRIGPNQRRALQMLQQSPAGLTRTELQTQLSIPDLRTMQTMLKALHQRKLIHIAAWRYESAGRSCPACRVFRYGEGEDAKKPAGLSPEDCRRRYKDRIGRRLFNRADEARKKGVTLMVIDGVTAWQKGVGFARAYKEIRV